jgi:hypothetical protein
MWLLDANMDVHIVQILKELGVDCDTAGNRNWKTLLNGELVAAAAACGFTCLLMRDQRFAESAARALKTFPNFAIVVIDLPQPPSGKHQKHFLDAWDQKPIKPIAGSVIRWPLHA